MTHILQIKTSLNGDQSASSTLADDTLSALLDEHPDARITRRDLGKDPIPHLDSDAVYAFFNADGPLGERQKAALALSDTLIEEIKQADILVLGVPMYNHGIPSPLKAWFDHIVRARVTFRYAEDGSYIGYLTGKKAIILASRGGFYANTDHDGQTEFLKGILAFVGITDSRFVYAEGMAIGEAQASSALAKAKSEIAMLTSAA